MSHKWLILAVSALVFTLFYSGCGGDENSSGSSRNDQIKALQTNFLNKEVADLFKAIERGVDAAAGAISGDRSFVLSYFVDGAHSSNAVTGITDTYLPLIGLDALSLREKTGALVSGSGTVLNGLTAEQNTGVVKTKQGYFAVTAKPLSIGDGTLYLEGGTQINRSFLGKLSAVTRAPVILVNENSVLLSSGEEVKAFSRVNGEEIILDGTHHQAVTVSLHDTYSLVAVIKENQ